jgi:uncharacterized membrane protein
MPVTAPFLFAVMIGPVVLGLLLLWEQSRTRQVDRAADATHAADDPSLGLTVRPPGAGVHGPGRPGYGPIAVVILGGLAFGLVAYFATQLFHDLIVW